MSSDLKRLCREYNILQNWLSQHDPDSKLAKIEGFSEECTVTSPTTENLSATASPSTNIPHASCNMLIYPSTPIFVNRGLKVDMLLPYTYPHAPPSFYMRSNIRHPNIHKNGKICIAKLESTKTWEPTPLQEILKIVIKLIEEPIINFPIDAEMANLYNINKEKYNETMKQSVLNHGIERK